MNKQHIRISKKLSYVLRHQPAELHLNLDPQGWVEVAILLNAFNEHFFPLTYDELREVVTNNDKKRFAFSDDGLKIRASQGHSITIDLDYQPTIPPDILFHGTATKNIKSIKSKGLIKGNRHHVHLSKDKDTAQKVGIRHGIPVILKVKAKFMYEEGFEFFESANGVWLTESVPVVYLEE